MNSDLKVGNAVSGKTARACDSCLRRRARWYCTADDAFLCQGCDGSVHSANPLARRHERVRLKTASLKLPTEDNNANSLPSWHKGFTRKARTPRNAKSTMKKPPKTEEFMTLNPFPLVPEMGSDEASLDENEEQLLYRVPVFDPLASELCTSTTSNNAAAPATVEGESEANLPGYLPFDMDLAEFVADVESLLGQGLDEDSFGMEGLGLLSAKEGERTMVKVEEEDGDDVDAVVECHVDLEVEMGRETLDLNFEYDSQTTAEEEEQKINGGYKLKLDYDAVITDWAGQGQDSPWITGDCWPNCLVSSYHKDIGGRGEHVAMGDGGREARVSRYREKRRTRLFSKKIRYEVRKLNAEKRPRMKGRFVKRSSFAGTGGFPF